MVKLNINLSVLYIVAIAIILSKMGNWLFGSDPDEPDYKLYNCDNFGGSYTNKLFLGEQKMIWEKKCRHTAGVAMVCPKCGEPSAGYCRCRKQQFFDELTDQDIKNFKKDKITICDKCKLNMVRCDCAYEERVRKIMDKLDNKT